MMRPDARLLPERVAIQPGTLRLPSGRELRVLKPFSIGRFTVTFDEFDHYCSATGYTPKADQGWGRGKRPVQSHGHLPGKPGITCPPLWCL